MTQFESTGASPIQTPRAVGILSPRQSRVLEVWQIRPLGTNYKERELTLPAEVRTRTHKGRKQRCEVLRRQIALQEWGHFRVRRYQATRMLPWTPSVGLAMLIPGTLLAAGSANQGILQVPLSLLILQSALITIGGLVALSSGWRLLTRRFRISGTMPIETLGVSGRALGFTSDVVASDPVPAGYRPGRYIGEIEVDLRLGEWRIIEEQQTDNGWQNVV